MYTLKRAGLAAGIVTAVVSLSAGLTPALGTVDASSPGSAPVFGAGAELHLRPLWASRYGQHFSNTAHVGTRVEAVGLGFHPGNTVRLIYALADTQFVMQPVARATVGANGRFDTAFTVTRSIDRGGPYASTGRYGGPVQPLLIEAYEGTSPGVGAKHAYAVTTLLVYSPELHHAELADHVLITRDRVLSQ